MRWPDRRNVYHETKPDANGRAIISSKLDRDLMSRQDDDPKVSLFVQAAGSSSTGPVELTNTPFNILVIGDLSGRDARGAGSDEPLSERAPFPMTSVDAALGRIRPSIGVPVEGMRDWVSIEFREMADFHPDQLLERVPHLSAFLASIDSVVAARIRTPPAPGASEPQPAGLDGLLDEIVEATSEARSRAPEGPLEDLKPWIEQMVAPHLVSEESADQAVLRRRLEDTAQEYVRTVLHSPSFQALESVWQALFFLAAATEPAHNVRIHVWDVARSELEADLGREDVAGSALLRFLTEPLPGPGENAPVALCVGAYTFGPEAADVALLNRIAMVSSVASVPWLSEASAAFVGLRHYYQQPDPSQWPKTDHDLWAAFRETPAARSVGLVAPRFLLREPYGEDTDPLERMALEELDGHDPGLYLWGNPAFACAAAIAASFEAHGWAFEPGSHPGLKGRPAHLLEDPGAGAGPAEAVWTVDGASRISSEGIMPLLAFRDETRLRLQRVGSVANAPASFHAWWLM